MRSARSRPSGASCERGPPPPSGRSRSAERAASEIDNRLTALLEENARLATQLEESRGGWRAAANGCGEAPGGARCVGEIARRGALGDVAAHGVAREGGVRARSGRRAAEDRRRAAQDRGEDTDPAGQGRRAADRRLRRRARHRICPEWPSARVRSSSRSRSARSASSTGFVVPSADSPPEVRKDLHEVSIRFDRAIEPRELRR